MISFQNSYPSVNSDWWLISSFVFRVVILDGEIRSWWLPLGVGGDILQSFCIVKFDRIQARWRSVGVCLELRIYLFFTLLHICQWMSKVKENLFFFENFVELQGLHTHVRFHPILTSYFLQCKAYGMEENKVRKI